MVCLDQIQRSSKVLLTSGGVLRALEIELSKRWIAKLVLYAGNFVVLTVPSDSFFLQHVIPTSGITVDREGTTFTNTTTYSQLASTNLLTLRAVHKEMSFPSFPGRASRFFVHFRHLEVGQRFT